MFNKKKETKGRRPAAGSQSRQVFSYYSNNRSAPEESRARYEPPVHRRRGLDRLKHVPTLVALVVIVGCALYASMLSSSPRVHIVATENGKSLQRPVEVYAEATAAAMGDSVFNKSKFTFNSQQVASKLRQQFPEVASVIVSVPIVGKRPVVSLAISSPVLVLATNSGAYYVSDSGTPLVKVSDVAKPLENIMTVSDESGLPVTPGTQVLPTETVTYIRDVIWQLQATQTQTQSITLPADANELQLRLVNQPYVVRLNTTLDPRVSVGTFLAVKSRLEGSGTIPKEYIDVRVEERVYYK